MVGRHEIGRWHCLVTEELRHAGAHENASPDVADHRIARISRCRIGVSHALHGPEDRVPDGGRADIAGQNAIAAPQYASFINAFNAVVDQRTVEHLPFPGAVAGVVGKLNGMDGPDLMAEALHGENSRGVADVTVSNMGLDGQNVHGWHFKMAMGLRRAGRKAEQANSKDRSTFEYVADLCKPTAVLTGDEAGR